MRARRLWRRRLVNLLMLGSTAVATALTVAVLFLLLGFLVYKGGTSLTWAFFTGLPKPVGEAGGGMANAIVGSGKLLLLAAIVGLPTGFMAGLYVSEFASVPMASAVRYTADLLNGVPSIVVGIFVYTLMVMPMGHFSALAGGVALGVMMIPIAYAQHRGFLRAAAIAATRRSRSAPGASRPSPGHRPGGIARHPHAAGMLGLARVARRNAPLLFTALGNPLLERRLQPADGVAAGDDLHLRDLTHEEWQAQAWAADWCCSRSCCCERCCPPAARAARDGLTAPGSLSTRPRDA
jgi:phosphate transport system permease protein